MGNSLSAVTGQLLVVKDRLSIIIQAILLITQLINLFRSDPVGQNPIFDLIEVEDRRRTREEPECMRNVRDDVERMTERPQDMSWIKRAQDEAEQAVKAVERRAEEARIAKEEQDRATREAEDKANEAIAAQREAERKWKEGIPSEVLPTAEELKETKARYQFTEGSLHFAITGVAGSGKSSFINAVRGLRNMNPGAAPTGTTETTGIFARYEDPNSKIIWYDLPGAGTPAIPDWEYFKAQGLYIFDAIIVLLDNRVTSTDIAILKNCVRFEIPSYIVRSKWNQHLKNTMADMGYDSEDEDINRRAELFTAARERFITDTRGSVQINLDKAQLPQKRVYIVAKDTLCSVIQGRTPKEPIDEVELIKDLFSDLDL